ncbi:phenylalanine--tRNA ligase subunit beta [Candidatus Woesearchaeota archaeon]|nr:phenylalanine--tRNA ligase subunit beta [Candidatus Woesearchaeota archaeon]
MPTVTLNKTVFEKLVGKKLRIDELKDRISMLGTDLESIEGNEINVEIFPNRPDMLSEQGFARAFSSFIGEKTGLRGYDIKKSGEKVIIDKSVSKVRPYTACAIVKNIKFDDEKIREVIQIQEKLHVSYGRNRKKVAIGVYPMEKIRFPITFFAEDPKKVRFLPLEAKREMTGLQVLSQHPTGRDYGHLLEGQSKFPFFKDADNKILSMPPIINSHDVGKVSEETKDVFIECSGFDYDVLAKCLNMIVTALSDMGGETYSIELIYPDKKITSPNLLPSKMSFDVDYINKRLGLDLKEKEIVVLLSKMGYGYDNSKRKILVPSYRADVLHQIDLVEDIAIAYGYENFEETIPKVATIGQESKIESFAKKIVDLLIGLKLTEVYSYNITSSEAVEKKFLASKPIMLSNSLSEGFDSVRSSMICSLLDILARNRHNEYPQRIFDLGTVFSRSAKEDTGIKEELKLAVALCEEKANFTDIKQILDYIFSNLDIKYELSELSTKQFLEGRSGEIIFRGKKIGTIGEVHPQVLENFAIEYPVSTFELNITELHRLI